MNGSAQDDEYLARHQKLLDEYSADFKATRDKLNYYTLSLPFAILGGAIASYGHPDNIWLAALEVTTWGILLLSGLIGVWFKITEVELNRQCSLRASSALESFKSRNQTVGIDRERAIIKLENTQGYTFIWHRRLLVAGMILWTISRGASAIIAVLKCA